MSGQGNETAAVSSPHWGLNWASTFNDFQLDIVGLIAVLGDSMIEVPSIKHPLPWLFYLPRLLPAPQALLVPDRHVEEKKPAFKAHVVGVISGHKKDSINHITNLLIGPQLEPYDVRCIQVRRAATKYERASERRNFISMLQPWKHQQQSTDVELEEYNDWDPQLRKKDFPGIQAKPFGPLGIVTLYGVCLTVVLFVLSLTFNDGYSLLATILLSFLSVLIGVTNKWSLAWPAFVSKNVPKGDFVIEWPNGSFMIVRCNEDVARELVWAPPEIHFVLKSRFWYRTWSLLGTIILMLGVIALSNGTITLQLAWAAAYITLNAAHWVAASMHERHYWDLSRYKVIEEHIASASEDISPNAVKTLWKAIALTENLLRCNGEEGLHWARSSPGTLVATQTGQAWLQMARQQAIGTTSRRDEKGNIIWNLPDWNATRAWLVRHGLVVEPVGAVANALDTTQAP